MKTLVFLVPSLYLPMAYIFMYQDICWHNENIIWVCEMYYIQIDLS